MEILQLVMDVPGAHPPAVERDDLFLDSGDVPLVLGDNLRLELAVPVPWDVNPKLPVPALELPGGMAVALAGSPKSLLISEENQKN